MFSPHEKWGPLLQSDRDFAWECHRQHGTTMGGKLKLDNKEELQEMETVEA